ncbi:GlsB/YeaQ/YmgE family stress response membrane protein [Niabella digestorum]
MTILSWILFGLIAGAIAKALHPGKDRAVGLSLLSSV